LWLVAVVVVVVRRTLLDLTSPEPLVVVVERLHLEHFPLLDYMQLLLHLM
jgi:hypothetical protein